MDLEKLKMTGAGRAIAVLTSGGDAQGHSNLKSTISLLKVLRRRRSCFVFVFFLWLRLSYKTPVFQ